MAYSIEIHDDAWADLEALWADPRTEEAAAAIDVLLQEIECDQDLLDALTAHDYGANKTKRFHVSKWVEYWRNGANIWRLKIWELEKVRLNYRIIYAYEIKEQKYHVLAVVPREFDYDTEHPISRRIMAVYATIR